MAIDEKKWEAIRQLLEDASQGKNSKRLQDVFRNGLPQEKRDALREYYDLSLDDMVEIHTYLEKVFHNSPLRFWWW